jgi:hypothetical protein
MDQEERERLTQERAEQVVQAMHEVLDRLMPTGLREIHGELRYADGFVMNLTVVPESANLDERAERAQKARGN